MEMSAQWAARSAQMRVERGRNAAVSSVADCNRVPARPMIAAVGTLIVAISIRTIVLALR